MPGRKAITVWQNTRAATLLGSATRSTNAVGYGGRVPANTGGPQPREARCPLKSEEPTKSVAPLAFAAYETGAIVSRFGGDFLVGLGLAILAPLSFAAIAGAVGQAIAANESGARIARPRPTTKKLAMASGGAGAATTPRSPATPIAVPSRTTKTSPRRRTRKSPPNRDTIAPVSYAANASGATDFVASRASWR